MAHCSTAPMPTDIDLTASHTKHLNLVNRPLERTFFVPTWQEGQQLYSLTSFAVVSRPLLRLGGVEQCEFWSPEAPALLAHTSPYFSNARNREAR